MYPNQMKNTSKLFITFDTKPHQERLSPSLISLLSNEIKEKYDWIPNISITFMEFLHGALRSKNKNACFFIRSKESLKNIPEEFNEKFYETNELSIHQLKVNILFSFSNTKLINFLTC